MASGGFRFPAAMTGVASISMDGFQLERAAWIDEEARVTLNSAADAWHPRAYSDVFRQPESI